MTYDLPHLDALETEAIHVLREVAAELEQPVLLFGGGRDSLALLRLAEKAFRPGRFPFPVLHVDTGDVPPERVALRDRRLQDLGERLIVETVPGDADGADGRTALLLRAVAVHGFDGAIMGSRRDDGRSRAEDSVLAAADGGDRGARHEVWTLYNGLVRRGERVRVFPLASWTEDDVAAYAAREGLELPGDAAAQDTDGLPGGELVRVALAGAAGDGKSALIERLRRATGADDDEPGGSVHHVTTTRRRFLLADTPGDPGSTPGMVSGASTANVALVLIDARKRMLQQSRRHAFIASLLRVPHVVVAVNKMDLVDFEEAVFDAIVREFTDYAARLDVSDVTFIPVSATGGDNVAERSQHMEWYGGPTLLHHLEHVHIASDRNLVDVRFPVQWVIRPGTREHHDYRGYAGQVAGGVLRPGDDVVVLPAGTRSRIAAIDTADGALEEAFAPMSVTVHLEDDLDVARGDLICRPQNRPLVERELDAVVCWLSETPSRPRGRYLLKHTTRTTPAVLTATVHRIDVDTLHRDAAATELQRNDIGRVNLKTATPLTFDPYRRNRATGSFILIDRATNETMAAGMLLGPHHRANVTWHPGEVTREHRWSRLGSRGATVWLTGLPASGKSTIAAALEERLIESGVPAYRLDGDNLRHGLNADLGFTARDRSENVRRAAHAARLLADAGMVAVVALVSPYTADRELARTAHAESNLDFLEVWVNTPVTECERRDPKGLYARARSGELSHFTGVDDPYEPPASADLELDPDDLEANVERLWQLLVRRGVILDAE